MTGLLLSKTIDKLAKKWYTRQLKFRGFPFQGFAGAVLGLLKTMGRNRDFPDILGPSQFTGHRGHHHADRTLRPVLGEETREEQQQTRRRPPRPRLPHRLRDVPG